MRRCLAYRTALTTLNVYSYRLALLSVANRANGCWHEWRGDKILPAQRALQIGARTERTNRENEQMPTGRIVHLAGFRIDKRTGQLVKSQRGKSVSARIAEKKKPKTKFKRGKS